MPNNLPITDNTRLTRTRERGNHSTESIYPILDDGILCHIGFEDKGHPVVLPTAYIRYGHQIMIHGAVNGRFFQRLAEGIPCCVTVSHLDGLVLARSAFHHSVNYRCAMLFGQFTVVTDLEEKRQLLDVFMEGCIPGRNGDAIRRGSDKEINATALLLMDINEASSKIRTGPPNDDVDDMSLPVWAGVVQREPARYTYITAPDCPESIAQPAYLDTLTF